MSRGPDFRVEGHDWPHREHSRFVQAGAVRWHVQVMGSGPAILMLHGSGASGHSFRALMPLLAGRFTLVVPDLPGHAFSAASPPFVPSLPAIAGGLAGLLAELRLVPELAVGHSAGAALLAQMAIEGTIAPRLLVGLAPALVPLRGAVTSLFAPAARLLARSPLAAQVLALRARDHASVERLVASTGSSIDWRGVELYRRLASHPGHVAAVLDMLAAWDLGPLFDALPRLSTPTLLVAGERDRAVPVPQLRRVVARLPRARLVVLPGAGHLLHEEQPAAVAHLILDAAERAPAASASTVA